MKGYLTENLRTLYSLVWGQCTDAICQKVEAAPEFKEYHRTFDSLGLLRVIRDVTYHFQSMKALGQSLHEAERRFFLLSQARHVSCQAYLEQFQNVVDVVTHCGGVVGYSPAMQDVVAAELGKTAANLTPEAKGWL